MAEIELKAQIEEAEKAIKEAETILERAKVAGIDTASLEADLAEQKEALEKLKTAFA